MLFADLSVYDWSILIGAFFLGLTTFVTQVISMVLAYFREQRADEDRKEVKRALEAKTASHNSRLDGVFEVVEQIHKATNSMKDELVDEVRKASYAQGVKSEKDKDYPGTK